MKFVKLISAGHPGIPERPIWVNPHLVQTVIPRPVRRPNEPGTMNNPPIYDVVGSFVTTDTGEEGTFAVVEEAETVVAMLETADRAELERRLASSFSL